MSDKCFVDTNILFYAHDRTAGFKHERAKRLVDELWESGAGVLSTQVLQEFCATVRCVDRSRPIEDLQRLVQDFSSWEIVVNTRESILAALEIESRYKISFWDALIVHAAQSSGASTLYSEDLNAGPAYGSIHVVNPLTA
jgi:predicted nucleic acid-binding protein